MILSDQKRLVADAYVRYRISDPLKFFQTVLTESVARSRLSSVVNSSLRRTLGNVTLLAVLSDEREQIMSDIQKDVNIAAQRLGLEIVDVRLRRADLPPEAAQAIYARMRSEREREAREARAQGFEKAQQIRAAADRERTVLIAEAQAHRRDHPRRRRPGGDADLGRRVRPGPRVLPLLPVDAGLPQFAQGRGHDD